MTCRRCDSCMLQCEPLRFHATSTDMSEQTHGPAYRCPICGHFEDNRVRLNRKYAEPIGAR